MLSYGYNPLREMELLRRELDRVFDDAMYGGRATRTARGVNAPAINLVDAGEALVLEADLPGFTEEQLTINLTANVVSIEGAREVSPPEGYSAHRRERGSYRFARSFGLPTKVDPEKTRASLKHGVLTLEMPKLPEARPRNISIKVR
ncbi:MAG: Hsp20/alpha crystallin family protein [Myxococcales bacterium]|nr:Hsp20/alpha crystallin family protein [Myxococcales bacterium]MCB9756015.1 Hsp20/alpha crystallin family protein [Myxococcales bacterium]